MADLKNYLDIIGGIFGIIAGIYAAVKIAGPWWRTRRDRRALRERFGAELYPAAVIERSTRHYIEPNCQSLDPASAEEPRLVYGAKRNLFAAVDEALQHPTEYRYLILLADFGMGKTSFLLNYYARHVFLGPRHNSAGIFSLLTKAQRAIREFPPSENYDRRLHRQHWQR